ncbi:MAG: thiamine pyrophosphate-dependent dehydrogenase E1 component subunit alpha [Myxococcales bacterium]
MVARIPSQDPGLKIDQVVRIYEAMLRTRLIDERMLMLQRQGRIGFHVGCRGEEACIVAAAAALREQDWIFPCYREMGALFWRGFPLQTYLDNMFGNADDVVSGRQMPDHFTARKYHYGSVSSPIGTQITQAVGFAWAAKIKREDLVAAAFFGDGATSSSDFHAALNMAGVFKTPNVFLCRNNRWAISVPSEKQTASSSFAGKAIAYGIKGVRCDGNDALAVFRTVREALARAVRGEGSTMVEMLTYRLGGHSSSDDPKAYRQTDEVEHWSKVDPLVRLRKHIEVLGSWDDKAEARARARVDAELKSAIEAAEKKPAPGLETMFDGVYAERPGHLTEQFEACAQGPRPRKGH